MTGRAGDDLQRNHRSVLTPTLEEKKGAARVDAGAEKMEVGERVVQKFDDFALRVDDRLVDLAGSMYIFRVEKIEGTMLLLKAEKEMVTGWTSDDCLVPIERGIEFFDVQVRTHPLDSFPRLMLARISCERKEYDKAMAEFTEAIRLEPNDARGFAGRRQSLVSKESSTTTQ